MAQIGPISFGEAHFRLEFDSPMSLAILPADSSRRGREQTIKVAEMGAQSSAGRSGHGGEVVPVLCLAGRLLIMVE